MTAVIPEFVTISGGAVHRALDGQHKQVVDLIEAAYRAHGAGETVNPPSSFLRFPDNPANRIIALPASVGGATGVAGLKWISSFPGNVASGIPRASAVLILNDLSTGYPLACLESSIISASRTAASAALVAGRLGTGRPRPARLGVVGTGLIARYVHTYLGVVGFRFDEIGVYDLAEAHAVEFASYLDRSGATTRTTVHRDTESLIRSSDLIVFATTAGTPHVHERSWFEHGPLVLHVSLRDLSVDVVLGSVNVVDDLEHCLTAGTSVHLAEQRTGSREHVHATVNDVLTGAFAAPTDRTIVFSPFGLGVLDLALAKFVHDRALDAGDVVVIDDFFHERLRYGGRS